MRRTLKQRSKYIALLILIFYGFSVVTSCFERCLAKYFDMEKREEESRNEERQEAQKNGIGIQDRQRKGSNYESLYFSLDFQ